MFKSFWDNVIVNGWARVFLVFAIWGWSLAFWIAYETRPKQDYRQQPPWESGLQGPPVLIDMDRDN